jgi:hypothetical protein
MKSYGPLYVGTLQYYHKDILPIVEKGWTQESELPFRKGSCLVFRFPKTYPGFYIGFWHKGSKMKEYDEAGAEDRLSKALGIRDMGLTPDDIEEWNV